MILLVQMLFVELYLSNWFSKSPLCHGPLYGVVCDKRDIYSVQLHILGWKMLAGKEEWSLKRGNTLIMMACIDVLVADCKTFLFCLPFFSQFLLGAANSINLGRILIENIWQLPSTKGILIPGERNIMAAKQRVLQYLPIIHKCHMKCKHCRQYIVFQIFKQM